MPAQINVMGINRKMGGLKESQSEFRKHNEEVGIALLNVAEGLDKDDPRPAYQHQSYPTMRYHADGREAVCDNDEQVKTIELKGYRKQPFPKAQVAIEDPKTEKLMLQAQLKEKDGQIAGLTEQFQLMQAQLQELINAKKK